MPLWIQRKMPTKKERRHKSRKASRGQFPLYAGHWMRMKPKAKVEDAPIINFTPSKPMEAIEGSKFLPSSGCPSREKGFCEICGSCYAGKSERYPNVYNFHVRQSTADYEDLRDELQDIVDRYPIKYVRFSETGDLRTERDSETGTISSKDLDTLIALAKHFPLLTFYGYTKAYDLEFDQLELPSNLILNISGYNFVWVKEGETPPEGYEECPCDMTDPNGSRCIKDCIKCATPDCKVYEKFRP